MSGRDETALVARAVSGDACVVGERPRSYEGHVYQVVLRITQNPADAADVYHEMSCDEIPAEVRERVRTAIRERFAAGR